MILGDRLRSIREAKQISQRNIAERAGLSRSCVFRVENGHEIPSIEVLEKWAVMEVPLHQFFYDPEQPPVFPNLPHRLRAKDIVRTSNGKTVRLRFKFY